MLAQAAPLGIHDYLVLSVPDELYGALVGLGVGNVWRCALRFTGGVDPAQQAVYSRLLTPLGERLMRPTYGSDIVKFLGRNISEARRRSAEISIRSALRDYPDIQITAITIVGDSSNLVITIYAQNVNPPITIRLGAA